MKNLIKITLAILIIGLIYGCKKEPINKNVIGVITNSVSGSPVVGALVKLNNQTSTTNNQGEYSFNLEFEGRQGLFKPGEIIIQRTISISKIGYNGRDEVISFNASKDSRREEYNVAIDPESVLEPKNGYVINIPKGNNESSLRLQNTGKLEVNYEIEYLDPWISISPSSGVVSSKELIELNIETDTSSASCDLNGKFVVNYSNFSISDTYDVYQPIYDSELPNASFVVLNAVPVQFDSTWFDASLSADNCTPKEELKYSWDFNNDNNWTVPSGQEKRFFVYTDLGPKTAGLRVYDKTGNVQSTSKTIEISQAPKAPTLENLIGNKGIELLSLNVECNLIDLGFPLNPGIVKHGFVLSSTTSSPTIANYQKIIQLNQKNATGLFSGVFNDLNPGVVYFIRAFADNGKITYSDEIRFTPEILDYSNTITVTDFNMGSTLGDNDNKPVFKATIDKSYKLSKTEVTVSQFVAFLNAKNKSIQSASQIVSLSDNGISRLSNNRFDYNTTVKNKPIRYITYAGATEFCEWAGGRLPTEAEWEYAARGGTQFSTYSGSDNVGNAAYYTGNTTTVGNVGLKGGGNIFGIFDMSGNVEEWVFDYYSSSIYNTYKNTPNPPILNPSGPVSGTYRVVRGGHYKSSADKVRVFMRSYRLPTAKSQYTGFRCLKEN